MGNIWGCGWKNISVLMMIHHADLVVVVVLTLINVETDKWSSNYMMVNLHQHFSLFILVLFRESRMDKEMNWIKLVLIRIP